MFRSNFYTHVHSVPPLFLQLPSRPSLNKDCEFIMPLPSSQLHVLEAH